MKKWYQSKTIWLNVIAALVAILGLFNQETLAGLGISTPEKFLTIIGTITTIFNIILRVLTKKLIVGFGQNSLLENGPGGSTNPTTEHPRPTNP